MTDNPEPTGNPESTGNPEPTASPTPLTSPEPAISPAPAISPEPVASPGPTYQLLTDVHPQKSSKKSSSFGLAVVALTVGALVGGASGAGVATWAISSNLPTAPVASPAGPGTITVNDAANATQVTAIAASSGPSVVTVSVQGTAAGGTGSGVIITEDGYIVTNTHVVTLDGETAHAAIEVQTYDGHLYTAKLVGTDPITDIAVIKIEGTYAPLQFADSSKLNVGDTAIAIGAPLGLSNTVTNGIVSALNRSITISSSAAPKDESGKTPEGEGESGPFNFWEFPAPTDPQQESEQPPSAADQANIFLPVVQTDAAINPGNSGGALLDADGKVIGINVAIAGTGSSLGAQSGNIGVGFAIPSNLAKRVAFEIINDGVASHGLLGATVMDVVGDAAITSKTVVGASVQSITNGGAADKAGIRKGDVVTAFNGLPITGSIDLTAQVRAAEGGSQATVTYLRGDKPATVTVTLGELN